MITRYSLHFHGPNPIACPTSKAQFASQIKPSQAVSIIGQVACTLAVAERELEFEHRNLNEENIIVLPSTSKNQHFLIDGRTCCVKGSGLKVTLFDDYLSRMTVRTCREENNVRPNTILDGNRQQIFVLLRTVQHRRYLRQPVLAVCLTGDAALYLRKLLVTF
ncbi:hypothetical protein HPB48_000676 [Haemaphysalis longicornis]|uniref:Protein kinase domain-containing protein n=1 Tax=Haemaphysalis longicornis TaxID=44386 RepID=A0A9J6GSC7_HAELO|nr:hypothetical protein HPB48_000676 [Haemaphysalis longicornis]